MPPDSSDIPAPEVRGADSTEDAEGTSTRPARQPSRRALLFGGGAAGLAAAAAGAGFWSGRATAPDSAVETESRTYPFTGTHQAGIVTPAQDRMYLAAFDLTTEDRDDLIALLRAWTVMAARLTQGLSAGPLGFDQGSYDAPPDDTGEAADLPPNGLTITFGFGRSLFIGEDGATDRFGLADRLPGALDPLPHFPGDDLDAARCDGDLIVQACADDPQVAVHAVRNLSRAAFGTARLRWAQLGYGRTSSTSTAQKTPRNLFGFKDGTANIKSEETDAVRDYVWVHASDAEADHANGIDSAWMTGGTYLTGRRIRMTIETWDRSTLREQERVVGRTKGTGAPLSGGEEFTEPDFKLTGSDGSPLIDVDSHVKLAHPTTHDGVRMLRRGYNFTDGNDELGRLDAGLYFIAFTRDPRTQYVPVQQELARNDLMSEYLLHTSSALFAIPAGIPTVASDGSLIDDQFVGTALFR